MSQDYSLLNRTVLNKKLLFITNVNFVTNKYCNTNNSETGLRPLCY